MSNKIIDIVSSWATMMNPTPKQKERGIIRANICYSCPHIKKEPLMDRCGKCGCPIRAKVFSDNGCPDNRW